MQSPRVPCPHKDHVYQDTPVMLPSFLLGTSDRQLIQKDRTEGAREPKNEKVQKMSAFLLLTFGMLL